MTSGVWDLQANESQGCSSPDAWASCQRVLTYTVAVSAGLVLCSGLLTGRQLQALPGKSLGRELHAQPFHYTAICCDQSTSTRHEDQHENPNCDVWLADSAALDEAICSTATMCIFFFHRMPAQHISQQDASLRQRRGRVCHVEKAGEADARGPDPAPCLYYYASRI